MGLWLGMAQRLQSSVCGFLNVLDSELKNVQKSFFDTVNATDDQLNKLTGGLTGGLTDPNNLDPLNILGGEKPKKTSGNNNGFNIFGPNKKKVNKDPGSLDKFSKPLSVFKGQKPGDSLFGL